MHQQGVESINEGDGNATLGVMASAADWSHIILHQRLDIHDVEVGQNGTAKHLASAPSIEAAEQ